MKTLFDLRDKTDNEIYIKIQEHFDEPLKIIILGDQSINACTGCWSCWLKTPGRCVMKDQMAASYYDYINSDTVILLMDTAQGFINHRAKAFLDRTIPHYNPYIEIIDGECHHAARYQRYPDMVFYYDKNNLTCQEQQVIEDYLYRTAYQFKSKACIIDDDNNQLLVLSPRTAKRKRPEANAVQNSPIDKLVIYNGSPRRRGSNSAIILNEVSQALPDRVEIRDLKQTDKWDIWSGAFESDKHVMFFMPLYVHAMPSTVMKFFEKLKPSSGTISYFIQSGFPESSQSHYLEAYFELLSKRLGRTYIGTAIKGGVEGLQLRPAAAQKKMIQPLVKTIVDLVNEGTFDARNIQQLAIPVRLSKGSLILIKILSKIGLVNYFWDKQLKENNAFEKRFDSPYLYD